MTDPENSNGNQVSTSSVAEAPSSSRIDMRRIAALADVASSMVEQIRSRLLAPETRKISPTYSTAQLANLCGVDKNHIGYRVTKDDLPKGHLSPTGAKRAFSLNEARVWTKSYRKDRMRPAGGRAITVAVGNFKGGVAKTTTPWFWHKALVYEGTGSWPSIQIPKDP